MKTETATWPECHNGGKAIVEQLLASEERKKSKRTGLWESQSQIQVGMLTIQVRSFEIETRVHQVYQFHQNRLAGPYDGSLNLQRKTHSKGVDQENLIYVRWNRIKNHVYSRCDQ